MTSARRALRVGLTGGIASGKSTVAARLAESGAQVIDADRLAAHATEPGGVAFDAVVVRFGKQILDPRGSIDRAALGRIVFSDPGARSDLESIVHPAVRAAAEAIVAELLVQHGDGTIVVFEAALLVETGAFRDYDRLIVTRCSRGTQIDRLLRRDGMTRAEAEARIDAQAPLEAKLALADFVVDTECSLALTRKQVDRIYAALVGLAAGGDPR